jgi:hypothetical protein
LTNHTLNIISLLDFFINFNEDTTSSVALQDYIEGAEQGDARIFY